jgi:hypothetical protein
MSFLSLEVHMKIPSSRTRQALEEAAELRAAGATWETIAGQLQRQKNVVSRWQNYYAEEWEQLLRDAEERTSRHANNEARNSLRIALRSLDAKERLAAAKQLAHMRKDEKAAQPITDRHSRYTHFTNQIQELSDEELRCTNS